MKDRKMMGRLFRLVEIDRILTNASESSDGMMAVKEIYNKLKERTEWLSAVNPGLWEFELHPKEEKTIRQDLELFTEIKKFLEGNESFPGFGYDILESEKLDPATGRMVKCYAIPQGKSFFKHNYSPWEIEMLSSLLQSIKGFDIAGQFKSFSENLRKLKKKRELDNEPELPPVIDLGVKPHGNPAFLPLLVKAVAEGEMVRIKYKRLNEQANQIPGEKEIPVETVMPLQIKRFGNRWVLLCAVKSNNYIINFSFDQILGISLTGERFNPAARNRVRHLYDNVAGPTLPREKSRVKSESEIYLPKNPDDGLKPENIIFFVLPHRANHVKAFPLMENERQHEISEEYTSKDYEILKKEYPSGRLFMLQNVYVTRELKERFFKWMDSLVVLEPVSLRKDIMRRLEFLQSLYGKI